MLATHYRTRLTPTGRQRPPRPAPAPAPIITVTPTLTWGNIASWYQPGDDSSVPLMAVSRAGVKIHAYLHQIPPAWLAHAAHVHRLLAADPYTGLPGLATHHHEGLPYTPDPELAIVR